MMKIHSNDSIIHLIAMLMIIYSFIIYYLIIFGY